MALKSYHYAWLSVHLNRTAEWLIDRIADGFDLHHADGDHYNDDPYNLVLIECTDHMRLHGSSLNRLLHSPKEEARLRSLAIARQAYEAKNSQISWRDIGREINPDSLQPAAWARNQARRFAEEFGLPFPKPGSNMPMPFRAEQ